MNRTALQEALTDRVTNIQRDGPVIAVARGHLTLRDEAVSCLKGVSDRIQTSL
jgi:hypothetical protein